MLNLNLGGRALRFRGAGAAQLGHIQLAVSRTAQNVSTARQAF
jgi:hypothetical protein